MSCEKYQREFAGDFSIRPQVNNLMPSEIYQYPINSSNIGYYHGHCGKKCCIKKEQSDQIVKIKIGGLKFSVTSLTFFVFISLVLMIVIIILIIRQN
ncbi:MAG: hypothetical protein LBJ32_00005 [Oscillospiraceae bacterium]|jgi:hypothetical protein|nr:hypothetical protein [Oscillospiraceae bacterium]